jgi:hypothetical protein
MAGVTIRRSGMKVFMDTDMRALGARLAKAVETQIIARAPVESGRLKSRIKAGRISVRGYHVRFMVRARTGYSLYPELGTGIYVGKGYIYPKRARSLVFKPQGSSRLIFAARIKGQPGKKVEPPKAPSVKIELAGKEYIARCPNDYEFTQIWHQMAVLRDGDFMDFDLHKMVAPFFAKNDYREIQIRMLGDEPDISLMEELLPAMDALSEYYMPYINDRGKTANREARRAKKGAPRR